MKEKLLHFNCRKWSFTFLAWCLVCSAGSFSCKKEIETSDVYTLRQWKVTLNPDNVVPAVSGRTERATAVFYLMTDNKLYYYLYFNDALSTGDKPAKAAVYTGAAGSNGTLLIDLANEAFNSSREVKGSVSLSPAQIDNLNTKVNYLQITSTQQPNGLVRGTLQSY